MTELRGRLVTPGGVVAGRVSFGERITEVGPSAGVPDRWILPGFIDVHVHGGGGADTTDGPDAVAAVARFHLRHGTTTVLPTTVTRPWPEVLYALRSVAEARRKGVPDGARIVGAHLEGPFINPERLGAQPPFAILPEPGLVEAALATGAVRVVTMAPELAGADDAMRRFASAGVRVSLGHSTADCPCTERAIDLVGAEGGTVAGTHLFNAMGGIAGRSPGLAGAVLGSRTAFAELILDGFHVHPAAFRLAFAALGDRLMLITDAMRGAGTADGTSELGGQVVTIEAGRARLADGTIAGSLLTMDGAFRRAVSNGAGMVAAAALTSGNAARYLGLTDRGSVVPGKLADLVVLDERLAVSETWVGGVRRA